MKHKYYKNLFLILFAFLISCKNKVDEVYELKAVGLNESAIQKINKIIDDDPMNAEAYFALGNILAENYEDKNALKEAINNFEKSLKIDPENKRFTMHNLMIKVLTNTGGSNSSIEEKIEQFIKKEPENPAGHVFMEWMHSKLRSDNDIKSYFREIAILNNLKPLNDWQYIYHDSTKQINAGLFYVTEENVSAFDVLTKESIKLKLDSYNRIDKIFNDTIYYTDYSSYKVIKRNAWRLNEVYWPNASGPGRYIKQADFTFLYKQPQCTETIFTSYPNYKKNPSYIVAPIISPESIESGSIKLIGRTYLYSGSMVTWRGFSEDINFLWDEVEYNEKVYPKRILPSVVSILLLNNEAQVHILSLRNLIPIPSDLLYNILRANYIAKNMTLNSIKQKNYLHFERVEFNRDNFKFIVNLGDKQLVFLDGLLSEINKKDSH